MKPLPGVAELPVLSAMPDVLVMNDGKRVTSKAQWAKRREEMKRILEYYAVGLAPPPPGNVKGKEIKSQILKGGGTGGVKYRLVHLTFGPRESLSLDIGIFTPVDGGPFLDRPCPLRALRLCVRLLLKLRLTNRTDFTQTRKARKVFCWTEED
jgi:hypothetical protein